MDIEPAIMPATPAVITALKGVAAAATPTIKLAVEIIPSLAPRTAARSQPVRPIKWRSGRRFGINNDLCIGSTGHTGSEHEARQRQSCVLPRRRSRDGHT